jgi:hypothetical protein
VTRGVIYSFLVDDHRPNWSSCPGSPGAGSSPDYINTYPILKVGRHYHYDQQMEQWALPFLFFKKKEVAA